MILSNLQQKELIKGLKQIEKLAGMMADWDDMTYREEAQKIKKIARAQLKIFSES